MQCLSCRISTGAVAFAPLHPLGVQASPHLSSWYNSQQFAILVGIVQSANCLVVAGKLLTDDYLEPEFGVMFFAGFETTGHSAAWVLYLVSQVGPTMRGKSPVKQHGHGLFLQHACHVCTGTTWVLSYLYIWYDNVRELSLVRHGQNKQVSPCTF